MLQGCVEGGVDPYAPYAQIIHTLQAPLLLLPSAWIYVRTHITLLARSSLDIPESSSSSQPHAAQGGAWKANTTMIRILYAKQYHAGGSIYVQFLPPIHSKPLSALCCLLSVIWYLLSSVFFLSVF